MDARAALTLGLHVQASRTRWVALSLRGGTLARGESPTPDQARKAADPWGVAACVGMTGERWTGPGEATEVAWPAAWMAAAGIAEPSTFVMVAEEDGDWTWAMHSRVSRSVVPPLLPWSEGLFPGYVGYSGHAATLEELLDPLAALRDRGVPVRRFVLTGPSSRATPAVARRAAELLGERLLHRAVEDGPARGAAIRAAMNLPRARHGWASLSQLVHALAGPRRSGTLHRPPRGTAPRVEPGPGPKPSPTDPAPTREAS